MTVQNQRIRLGGPGCKCCAEARQRDADASGCLHDRCKDCGGTGQKRDGFGPCIHFIACPCSKCAVIA